MENLQSLILNIAFVLKVLNKKGMVIHLIEHKQP